MNEKDLVQLMCNHSFRRDEQRLQYGCRCGITIDDRDLVAIPKQYLRELTTWLAYHFDNDPED